MTKQEIINNIKAGYLVKVQFRGDTTPSLMMVIPAYAGELVAVAQDDKWASLEALEDARLIAVYGYSHFAYKALRFDTSVRPLLWEEPAKEMTQEELDELLGYKVKIIQ